MSENEAMTNQEQTDINFGDYIDSIPQLKRGAIVKGVVSSADADYVYVDVRDKSEGKIPRREVEAHRENLIVGSACFNGEVFDRNRILKQPEYQASGRIGKGSGWYYCITHGNFGRRRRKES